jgi:hypothetical protein
MIRAQQSAQPVSRWLDDLGTGGRATTLVKHRLESRHGTQEHRSKWFRRTLDAATSNPFPTDCPQHILRQSAQRAHMPVSTAVLWHTLTLLHLDGEALELDTDVRARLNTAALPPQLRPLLEALDRRLAHR